MYMFFVKSQFSCVLSLSLSLSLFYFSNMDICILLIIIDLKNFFIVLPLSRILTKTVHFQFRNDEVQLEEDTPYSYEIFHIVFAMGAMYFAMLFISWELNHPTRK
jgi:hypothetical protein